MFKYSLLIIICFTISVLVGVLYRVKLVNKKAIAFTFLISFIFMVFFNTYLTSLPIVEYNDLLTLNIKIISFPVEDVGYLVVACILLPLLYEVFLKEDKSKTKAKGKGPNVS